MPCGVTAGWLWSSQEEHILLASTLLYSDLLPLGSWNITQPLTSLPRDGESLPIAGSFPLNLLPLL